MKFDRKHILVAVVLLICFLGYYFFKQPVLNSLKYFLELEWIYYLLGAFAFTVTLIHKLKFKGNPLRIESSFVGYLDSLDQNYLSLLITPGMTVTSLSLSKGLFLQYFFSADYFPNFGDAEIYMLRLVTPYVLFQSFMTLRKLTKEAFTVHVQEVEKKEEVAEQRKVSNL